LWAAVCGTVETSLVDCLFGFSVNSAWESTIQTLINGIRKGSNQPLFLSHVDYLFKRLSTYKKENAEA